VTNKDLAFAAVAAGEEAPLLGVPVARASRLMDGRGATVTYLWAG